MAKRITAVFFIALAFIDCLFSDHVLLVASNQRKGIHFGKEMQLSFCCMMEAITTRAKFDGWQPTCMYHLKWKGMIDYWSSSSLVFGV